LHRLFQAAVEIHQEKLPKVSDFWISSAVAVSTALRRLGAFPLKSLDSRKRRLMFDLSRFALVKVALHFS